MVPHCAAGVVPVASCRGLCRHVPGSARWHNLCGWGRLCPSTAARHRCRQGQRPHSGEQGRQRRPQRDRPRPKRASGVPPNSERSSGWSRAAPSHPAARDGAGVLGGTAARGWRLQRVRRDCGHAGAARTCTGGPAAMRRARACGRALAARAARAVRRAAARRCRRPSRSGARWLPGRDACRRRRGGAR